MVALGVTSQRSPPPTRKNLRREMEQEYRVGQRVLVDDHHEMVVCDVREDGTAYAASAQIENTRRMISDKGVTCGKVEKRPVGRCKCLARTLDEHRAKISTGDAASHVYVGPYWSAPNDERNGIK
jgi:hypothetical protein